MESIELKFLLKLLGQEDYRALVSKLQLGDKTSASARDKICRDLADREIVGYSREIIKFKIDAAGKALLKQETTEFPVSEEQLIVLKACAEKSITPGTVRKLPATARQTVIQDLEAKGLIKVDKVQIKEVWLTERGREYLREECNPSGKFPVISLDLLKNYLTFLRKELRGVLKLLPDSANSFEPASHISESHISEAPDIPSDEAIVEVIKELDRELGTENYLPIFYLRQKVQPLLSRDELDRALYRLQRNDLIELSSLQEAAAYTPEQIDAGIPQNVGGSLFFITVN
ncbi:MAG: hypothetical protein HC769_08345 [Cyanobacteria bacterium CRU_2_1]|nr:hypothetical protein [Cyanobacteria bacterium RU_5_0]NJR58857.1 hypothetical protein [Cyanobacteria bacterium CRU_2_1]